MNANACNVSLNNHGMHVRPPDRFYADCLGAVGGAGNAPAMVLNDRGEVLFCNDSGAIVFGTTPEELSGRPLSQFVLNLRLNAWNPDGNVAYAAYTGRRNQWREYCVLDANGFGFSMELLLDALVVDLRYLILLWLRVPAKRAMTVGRPALSDLGVSETI